MDDPFKVLQATPILVELWLYDGYTGKQLRIERGGFQKLKNLGLRSLTGLNRLMINEGALPLLDQFDIGPCPDSFLVTGIHHLKSLKIVDFLICQPNSFLVHNQMKILILGKSSIFPLSLSCIGFVENTTKATSLVIQKCWSVNKVDSRRTKVPTPLSGNYRYVLTNFSVRLLHLR